VTVLLIAMGTTQFSLDQRSIIKSADGGQTNLRARRLSITDYKRRMFCFDVRGTGFQVTT